MSEQIKWADLTPAAQETALKAFARFYVQRYKQDGLEIIGGHANDRDVAEVNQILSENPTGTVDHDAAVSLRLVGSVYRRILADLDLTFTATGEPEPSYAAWVSAMRAKLPHED